MTPEQKRTARNFDLKTWINRSEKKDNASVKNYNSDVDQHNKSLRSMTDDARLNEPIRKNAKRNYRNKNTYESADRDGIVDTIKPSEDSINEAGAKARVRQNKIRAKRKEMHPEMKRGNNGQIINDEYEAMYRDNKRKKLSL